MHLLLKPIIMHRWRMAAFKILNLPKLINSVIYIYRNYFFLNMIINNCFIFNTFKAMLLDTTSRNSR